jgi:hypothetical protein
VTWEHIGKLSAAIPFLRRLKHHYEYEVNHFLHGTSHTSPAAEEDIANLQDSYHHDAIHVYKPGRKSTAKDKLKDYTALGTDGKKLSNTITRWQIRRDTEVSTIQIWEPE